MAHPVSGDVAGYLARAGRWYRWLSKLLPDDTVIAPWILYVELVGNDADPEERAKGIAGDLMQVGRCDGVVLVGGRVSEGMVLELEAAKEYFDLTFLGSEPPRDRDAEHVGRLLRGQL